MLPEIAVEALYYLGRTALEGLQMHSRYLRDVVNRHVRTLPLRYIQEVEISYSGVVRFLGNGDATRMDASGEQNLEVLFHRVNNAFIHRMTLALSRQDLELPYYLQANANELQCQVGALHVEESEEEVDYAIVDFLGGQLKPTIYEATILVDLDVYAMLFTHAALRRNVKHLAYKLFGPPAPECILPELFGVDVVDTCTITTEVDPRPWIRQFIETFEKAERGTDVTRSVTLLYLRNFNAPPFRHNVDPLGQPHRTDAPRPHSTFVDEWCRRCAHGTATNESPVADLFVFENVKLAKKLEASRWAVKEVDHVVARTYLHYAFLLTVV